MTGKNLKNLSNFEYTVDRSNNCYSAIQLNNGFVEFPWSNYFSGPFSFITWFQLNAYYPDTIYLLDFGNENFTDNIGIRLYSNSSDVYEINAFISNSEIISNITILAKIELNAWNHIAFILDENNNAKIYLNGSLNATNLISNPPLGLKKVNNLIGKNSGNITFNEMRIYHGSLTASKIKAAYLTLPLYYYTCLYLTNSWSMSNLTDEIGGADLYNGLNYSFTCDRYNEPNSSVYLDDGYLQIPAGNYFLYDFTITAWVYIISYTYNSIIFDFGNLNNTDSIFTFIADGTYASISNPKGSNSTIYAFLIRLRQWYHIAFVLYRYRGYLYINGVLVSNGTITIPSIVLRESNFFGRSNQINSNRINAILDDIKLYRGAMTSVQVQADFKKTSKGGYILS
jgi:hypothetical protein